MLLTKAKIALTVLLALGLLISGGTALTGQRLAKAGDGALAVGVGGGRV